jgi:hypothetical protein
MDLGSDTPGSLVEALRGYPKRHQEVKLIVEEVRESEPPEYVSDVVPEDSLPIPRKRGRPVKRKRGRPRKNPPVESITPTGGPIKIPDESPPRKRGRPKKIVFADPEPLPEPPVALPRKRGRPRKNPAFIPVK